MDLQKLLKGWKWMVRREETIKEKEYIKKKTCSSAEMKKLEKENIIKKGKRRKPTRETIRRKKRETARKSLQKQLKTDLNGHNRYRKDK